MELLENKQKIGIILLAIIAIIGIATYVLWQTNDNHEEEILTQEQNEIQVEPLQEEEEQETIMIHIMGEVQTPGVVTLPEGARMIDQTTPNMIQRISGIFERNALISKEI